MMNAHSDILGLHRDPLQAYELALSTIKAAPENSRAAQHAAVLALAQCGATGFALAEYDRYGLSACHDDEDVMALLGRLYKDKYLSAVDAAQAIGFAEQSARAYRAAHEATQGYYSAINAATMGLMAGDDDARIAEQASAILQILPSPKDLTPELHYFIEATRAECYWLQNKPRLARESLQSAVQHDPLNFGAHATTLKQFRMIASKHKRDAKWLSEFSPPTSVHYAGHNFAIGKTDNSLPSLTLEQCQALTLATEDAVQRADIGFGFGALAAGSDILIAEALLSAGAELHVTLPASVDVFIKSSVAPYGQAWVERFHACLNAASRVHITSDDPQWPSLDINAFCGGVAMGQARLRAASLAAPTAQLVIWDERERQSYTAAQVSDARKAGLPVLIVAYPGLRKDSSTLPAAAHPHINMSSLEGKVETQLDFESLDAAAQAAFERHSETDSLYQIAIEVSLRDTDGRQATQSLAHEALPGLTLLSENAACLFAARANPNYGVHLIGVSKTGKRHFALKPH